MTNLSKIENQVKMRHKSLMRSALQLKERDKLPSWFNSTVVGYKNFVHGMLNSFVRQMFKMPSFIKNVWLDGNSYILFKCHGF